MNFKDKEGTIWTPIVNAWTAKVYQEKSGLILLDMTTEKGGFLEAISDNLRFIDLLEVLLERQLKERKVTIEDLFYKMDGDHWEKATMAVVEANIEFMPEKKKKVMKALYIKKLSSIEEIYQKGLENLIEKESLEVK